MKNRIKTYSFWVSLSGAVVVLVQAIGRAVGFIANADIISNIIMGIAGVLVVLGLVTAPTEEELESKNNSEKKEKDNKDDSGK